MDHTCPCLQTSFYKHLVWTGFACFDPEMRSNFERLVPAYFNLYRTVEEVLPAGAPLVVTKGSFFSTSKDNIIWRWVLGPLQLQLEPTIAN